MSDIRGDRMAMIFQEPMTSLNPSYTIGNQLEEAFLRHRRGQRRAARERAEHMLERVGIPAPASRLGQYPHQLSGGLRQRVMIAMALMCSPDLIIADEPTTALDVTIQAQILELLLDLKKRLGMAMLLITHNLGIVGDIADRVAVMYAGQIVELAPANDLLRHPLHPYTRALMNSVPRLGHEAGRLQAIGGTVPNLGAWPKGCRFFPRCPNAARHPECENTAPELLEVEPGRWVRCLYANELKKVA
jgi:oligopeptide/dipeptide ABC transporter ATP-binding protein